MTLLVGRTRTLALPLALLWLASCKQSGPVAANEVGVAYVAPTTVTLRGDLSQKTTVAVLKHGDRVHVLDQKRRFVQIRSAGGATGWVDAFQLLTPEQMADLNRQHEEALALPSEGAASVYDPLNVHLEPSRISPSFTQIPQGDSVEVLQYRLVARSNAAPKPPVFTIDRPQPERRERKKKKTQPSLRLPPKPAPPGLPRDYEELSAAHVQAPKPAAPVAPQSPAKPPVMEEWTLIRTRNRLTGWVLSRNLVMLIPDEVAQYAEGKRITSYFSLGEVKDDETGTVKHDWLWTTESEPASFDFDAWRVFVWSKRHHRFETSFRQRNVEGYFPIRVDGNQFSLLTKDDDGKLRRRTYSFDGTLVHLIGTGDVSANGTAASDAAGQTARSKNATQKQPGFFQRLWNRLFKHK